MLPDSVFDSSNFLHCLLCRVREPHYRCLFSTANSAVIRMLESILFLARRDLDYFRVFVMPHTAASARASILNSRGPVQKGA